MVLKTTWTVRVNRSLPQNLHTQVILRTAQTANLVLAYLKKALTGPRSGRWYYLPGGGMYKASAPGEYPARRTGQLVNTLQTSWDPENLTAVVGSSVPYARYLEKKDPSAGGRPWLSRAAKETDGQVKAIWAQPWNLK